MEIKMNKTKWESEHCDQLFDAWAESDIESFTDFKNQAWGSYMDSLRDQQVEHWENLQ